MVFLAALALAPPLFCPPQPWALGFAAPPRLPFAGDVDQDGYADLIVVYPPGDAIVDVNLTVEGEKSGVPFQARTQWGKDVQAAAVGELDAAPGTDVVGLAGTSLRLAGAFAGGKYLDTPDWATLPKPLDRPALAVLDGGKSVLAFSTTNGEAYRIDSRTREAQAIQVPANTVWIGDAGSRLVAQSADGELRWLNPRTFRLNERIARVPKGSRPAAADGLLAYGDQVWTPRGTRPLPQAPLPQADTVRAIGDFDHDGDADVVEFRYGTEHHTAHQVLLYRQITPGETDPDHDRLTNENEARLGTDPLDPDTDNDALLDGWEVQGTRGLDLPGIGCDPLQTDIVCLVSRFDAVAEAKVLAEMKKADAFYRGLKTPNPNGNTGFRFHPVYLAPVTGDDTKQPWQTNRDKFRPEKWRGLVHWMQITPGGGGQADQLGDGGGCGEGAMWAAFVHELGHQIGLDHQGFWDSASSPTYPSLMNYNYSYSYEGSIDNIRYSDGSLASYVLKETDLDETIPLPYERVKFLEGPPYRFRLKPNGDTTLIDWNWNGEFGEKHIRADINYAYSTHAGRRDDVGKSNTSPWLFVHDGAVYVLYGATDAKADDPALSPTHTGRLLLRKLKKPYEWEDVQTLLPAGLAGDPVAASFEGKIYLTYATPEGVVDHPLGEPPRKIADNPNLVPTVAVHAGRRYVFLWNPDGGAVTYLDGPGPAKPLGLASTNPIGACTDGKTGELVLAAAANQDANRPNRWQIRRCQVDANTIQVGEPDWIEGPDGQSRGTGRLTLLYEDGAFGRLLLFGRGMTTKEAPWACTYVAMQIADKSLRGGWLVRRYYDEWTQSRSAPAAAWFGNDVIWAYRWVDGAQGPTDNNLHVGYQGLGIHDEPMGDHDDLTFLRTFGVRNSILALGRAG